jgi:hypothetical protein
MYQNDNRTVSVAMSTFNGERYIYEQIKSIMNQTRPIDELVLSDGGSTDRTLAIVEEMGEFASFSIKILRPNKRLYPHENFAKAVAHCQGDIIFLCDQDDVWMDHKVEAICSRIDDRFQVCISDFSVCDADLTPHGTYLERHSLRGDRRGHVHGCAVAMSSSFASLALPFPPAELRVWFDQWLAQLSEALDVRSFLNEPLHMWRRHAAAWSGEAGIPQPTMPVETRRYGTVSDQLVRIDWQIRANMAVTDRLTRESPPAWAAARRVEAVGRLSKENARLRDRRDALLRAPPRLMSVARNFVLGGYTRFGGLKSAIKDVYRT